MSESDGWITKPEYISLGRFFHALGVMLNRWSLAELQLQQLAWFLIGCGPEIGGAVTFSLGNVERTNLILTLAREQIGHPAPVGFFEYAVKLFNRNRENRNYLAHCRYMRPIGLPEGQFAVIQRFSAPGRTNARMRLLPLTELRAIADEIDAMRGYFQSLFDLLEREGDLVADDPQRLASLDRPPLPRTLEERLLSFDPVAPPPPSPSRE